MYNKGGRPKSNQSISSATRVKQFRERQKQLKQAQLNPPRHIANTELKSDQKSKEIEKIKSILSFDKATLKATINNIKVALKSQEFAEVSLKFDTFYQKILIKNLNEDRHYRFIEEKDYTKIALILENKGFKKINKSDLKDIILNVAQENKINSVRSKILKTKLHTKNQQEIKKILETFFITGFGAQDTPYNRLFSLTFLTSMVKRIFKPGCQVDWLFILFGTQGVGKSRGLEAICKHFANTYTQAHLITKDNDLHRLTIGKIIVEISELYGLATKALEAIKAFISKSFNEWVEKYQTETTKHYLTNILIGTTNEREHLTDATGNRRFLFIDVGVNHSVNIQWIEDNILEILKITLIYLRTHNWQLPYREINQLAQQEHHQYEATSIEEEKINLWLFREINQINIETGEKEFKKSKPITWDYLILSDVLLRACNIERPTRIEQINTAKALKRLGYERKNKKLGNQVIKAWIKT